MSRSSKKQDLELPLGKRTVFYRAFEMLPGLVSYSLFALLILLSIVSPMLASVYLFLLIITMIIKALGIAYHSVVGHHRMKRAQEIDWQARLSDLETPEASLEVFGAAKLAKQDEYIHKENLERIVATPKAFPKPSQVYNGVIIAAYNEPIEVIEPTVQSLIDTTYDKKQMILVFAYEERGGKGMEQTVSQLHKKYGKHFKAFIPVKHPKDLPKEVIGKGPNITYAAQQLEKWCKKQCIDLENVVITTLDCDNKPYPSYFDYLTYEYIVHEDRKRLSYQPIALYFGNLWDAPAPMRIIAIGNSFWTIVSSMRPHMMRNFAAHSQPMDALAEMDYWSKRSIVEDGHQYWRSYFHFEGDYRVIPIHVPVYQDAVMADTIKGTLIAQFKQLRRWAYGASDVPYVAERVFTKKRNVPFFAGFVRFATLLDSHVTLATIAILIAIGAWVPLLLNPEASRQIAAHNLPEIVAIMQRFAMIGILVTIILSIRMLPPRPSRYKRSKTIFMVLQWVLMPITAIMYNSMASLTAQTYLLRGKYLDKFDVTEKATYETAARAKKKS